MTRSIDGRTLIREREGVLCFLLYLTQNRELAEEVTQETFKLVLAKGLSPTRTKNYGAWLRGVAKNVLRKYWQRNSSSQVVFSSEIVDLAEDHYVRTGGDRSEKWEDQRVALLNCIEKLSESNRSLILQRYEQGQGVKEIAAAMGMEPNTLSKKLERIRMALRDCVKGLLRGRT